MRTVQHAFRGNSAAIYVSHVAAFWYWAFESSCSAFEWKQLGSALERKTLFIIIYKDPAPSPIHQGPILRWVGPLHSSSYLSVHGLQRGTKLCKRLTAKLLPGLGSDGFDHFDPPL